MSSTIKFSILAAIALAFAGSLFVLMPSISSGGLSLALTAEACCGDGGNEGGDSKGSYNDRDVPNRTKAGPTCDMWVSPSTIVKGQSATLSWSSDNAVSATISGIGSVSLDGSRTVSPAQTTTYTGTFKNSSGRSVTCSKTIDVTLPPPPPPPQVPAPTCDMWVSPSSITRGQSSVLSWNSLNAVSASIDNGIGSVSVDGSRTVSPHDTTTYTGTFRNSSGVTVNCSKTITVTVPAPNAPTCDLWVSPSKIRKGESATLSWNSENASSASLNNGIGSVSVDGSRTVSPDNTTTYTATFVGSGGTVTCSKTIVVETEEVKKEPTCSLNASDTRVERGDKVKLTWSSQNTSGGRITGGVGDVGEIGTAHVYPRETTTYTGTFYGDNGDDVVCKVKVMVEEEEDESDLWCRLTVSDETIERGDKVKLSWDSRDAKYGKINNGIGRVDESGSEYVYPSDDTTYIATFYGEDDDEVVCKAKVEVEYTYVPPTYPPYITLDSVPYTGFDLGPVGTFVYYSFMVFWAAFAAYLIAVRRIHNDVYRVLKTMLYGTPAAEGVENYSSHVAWQVAEAEEDASEMQPEVNPAHEGVDSFVLQQIARKA